MYDRYSGLTRSLEAATNNLTDLPSRLAGAAGHLMREVPILAVQTSLERAASLLAESACERLPVLENGRFVGIFSNKSVIKAIADGASLHESLEHFLQPLSPEDIIAPNESGASALRRFELGAVSLFVVDHNEHILGVLTVADLFPQRRYSPRPPMVGGMATPFGVYLTTGGLSAGPGGLALVATGATMGIMLLVAVTCTATLSHWLQLRNANDAWIVAIESYSPILFFLAALRIIPLAGIHAAEHKVVHAIEEGEELVAPVVSRMSRIHPRCGTNLAAAAGMFMGIFTLPWPKDNELRLLLAMLTTLFFARPFGSFLQFAFTTKPPNQKQILMGIRSGNELLEKCRHQNPTSHSGFARLWNSGMLHVLVGSSTVLTIGSWILSKFGMQL